MNAPIRDPWIDRLSEYLDGELNATERADCDEHLAGCAECARTLAALEAVAEKARALPMTPPEKDLWRGIEARLDARVLDLGVSARHTRRASRRHWEFGLGQLAAAAAVLVAVTALGTWFIVGRGHSNSEPLASRTLSGSSIPTPAAPQATPSAPSAPSASAEAAPAESAPVASLRADEAPVARTPSRFTDRDLPATAADFGVARYDAAVAELETALQAQRGKLDPKTVQVVERNLAQIDKAIAEARSALAADPASRYLNAHLASTMRRKVDLLRRVTDLAGTRI